MQIDGLKLGKACVQAAIVLLLKIDGANMQVLLKTDFAQAVPFIHGFFGTPKQGGQFYQLIHIGSGHQLLLVLVHKFRNQVQQAFGRRFNIDAHPALGAYDSRRKIAAMRYGEMMGFVGQKRLAGIGYLNEMNREIGEKMLQQIPPSQMLQALVCMRNATAKRHFFQEKILGLGNFPNGQPCVFVDSM